MAMMRVDARRRPAGLTRTLPTTVDLGPHGAAVSQADVARPWARTTTAMSARRPRSVSTRGAPMPSRPPGLSSGGGHEDQVAAARHPAPRPPRRAADTMAATTRLHVAHAPAVDPAALDLAPQRVLRPARCPIGLMSRCPFIIERPPAARAAEPGDQASSGRAPTRGNSVSKPQRREVVGEHGARPAPRCPAGSPVLMRRRRRRSDRLVVVDITGHRGHRGSRPCVGGRAS